MVHHLAEEPLIIYLFKLFLHIRNPKLHISVATFCLKHHFYLNICKAFSALNILHFITFTHI